jgi:hypothetical protein
MPTTPSPGPTAVGPGNSGRPPERVGVDDLLAEADALRLLLQEACGRISRLVAALKHKKRESRALETAVASLRQLNWGPWRKERTPMVISYPGPFALRWLQRHLDRLHESLGALRQQVRDALARVLSDAVGKAVREVIQTLASTQEAQPVAPSSRWSAPVEERHQLWEDAPSSWSRGAASGWNPDEDDEMELEEHEAEEPPGASAEVSPPTRKSQALALGLQAAAWWLRRRASLVKAVAVGAVAAVTAYATGPLVVVASTTLLGLFSVP